jgi:phytoene desaturase
LCCDTWALLWNCKAGFTPVGCEVNKGYRHEDTVTDPRSEAIVIGAGLGGLAAAMRLGAKGYRVTVLDRLDRVGGRGSSITENGHRFDLGPTIVTVPEVFRKLWAACGRDFDADVDLRPLDPFYDDPLARRVAFHRAQRHRPRWWRRSAAVARRREGLPAVPRGFARRRYVVGYEGMVAEPMHRLWDTIKVLPEFARLRADRSILGHARARVKDERLRMALSFHPLFIGGDPMNVTSMYALVSHLEKEYGVHYAIGGVQAIADAMARVVEGQGGASCLASRRTRSSCENGAAAGRAAAGGEVIEGAARHFATPMRGIPIRGFCGTCRRSGGRTGN